MSTGICDSVDLLWYDVDTRKNRQSELNKMQRRVVEKLLQEVGKE